jgi:hypothetical protein
MKRFYPALGIVIALLVAVFVWRAMNPPLSDSQQIAANLDSLVDAANRRSARGVSRFLAPNFEFGGTKKRDFQPQLAGALLQYRVVELKMSGVQTTVNGQTATSSGRYNLSLKSETTSPPALSNGEFKVRWRKVEGEWKIEAATGTLPGFN